MTVYIFLLSAKMRKNIRLTKEPAEKDGGKRVQGV